MLHFAHGHNLRAILSVLLLVCVTACAGEQAPKQAPKPLPPVAGAERLYALNLSMARLALIKTPDQLHTALPYINKLNAYALGPHQKNVPFSIVQLYFTEKGTGTKYVAFAPVAPADSERGRFDSLHELVDQLRTFNPEYYRVQVRNTHFDTLEPVSVWRTDATAARTSINQIYSVLNTNATLFTPVDNAALKLELTEFFMNESLRDAAYLSLESAKSMLALAARNNGESAQIKTLSKKLTRVENTLNEKLPYTW